MAENKIRTIMPTNDAKDRLNKELAECKLRMKDWYRIVYLRSDHWRSLREQAFEKYGRICHECKRRGRMDVHHLNYRSIFDVSVDDLQVLCRKCHRKEHPQQEEPTGFNWAKWLEASMARADRKDGLKKEATFIKKFLIQNWSDLSAVDRKKLRIRRRGLRKKHRKQSKTTGEALMPCEPGGF